MIFLENFRIAFRALWANKMRSVLTTLGIIIGVAAVIAVVSIVQGLQFMVTNELQGVGAAYVFVVPQTDRGDNAAARQVKLTWDDGKAIRDDVMGVKEITPVVMGTSELRYRDRKYSTTVLGVNGAWPDIVNYGVDRGRFLSQFDVSHHRKVAVIGPKVIEELRMPRNPIGDEIYVGRLPATVIGVMEERGRTLGENPDELVFIPFDTALQVFGRDAGNRVQLRMQATSTEAVPAVKDGITHLLRQRHHLKKGEKDDFRIFAQDELLKSISSVLSSVTAVVGAVVGVALLVGGIGIMNIMLVSVTERTREIGVRKSVGARRRDILVQFLIEAVALSFVGGAIGLILGYGLGSMVTKLLPGGWPAAHVPLWAIALAFGFSAAVGIIFGVYPANKASRLDPIDALRYE